MSYRDRVNDQVPCYNCKPPVRHLGCHSECQKYIDYKAESDKAHEKERICKSVSYNKHFI